jgi:hypothetical protein
VENGDLLCPEGRFDIVLGMDVWIGCSFFIDGPGRRFGVMG